MTFEADGMKVTQPLDPYWGPRFTDPVLRNMENDTLDHLYTLTIGKRADYINPIVDSSVCWRNIQSAGEDVEVTFDN
jgi:hypothetical protein